MAQVTLPRLAGTREAVTDLFEAQAISPRLSGDMLVVLGRELASGSTSFADELVKVAIVDRGADELVLVGAPGRFIEHVQGAAQRRHVADRVKVRSAAEAGI